MQHRSPSHFLRAALPIASLLAYPSVASAQAAGSAAAQESKALIEQALVLREKGLDEEALPLFVRALSLDPSPRARAQLALEHQALGRWVDAEAGLEAALAVADDPWVAHHRQTLEKALARVQGQLGWIEVTTNVAGAEVSIDGAQVGTSPLPGAIRVPIGNPRVDVRARGHVSVSREAHIVAGEHAFVTIALESESAPSDPAPPAASPQAFSSKGEPPARGEPNKSAAWLTLGGSVVLLGVGVAASVVREAEVSQWNSPSCLGVGVTRTDKCAGHQTAANTATTLAIVAYASAGALGVTSFVLFLRGAPAPAPAPMAVGPRCGVGALSVWCGGAF